MIGALGSRVAGVKDVPIRSHSRLCLLLQFENGNQIDNRFDVKITMRYLPKEHASISVPPSSFFDVLLL